MPGSGPIARPRGCGRWRRACGKSWSRTGTGRRCRRELFGDEIVSDGASHEGEEELRTLAVAVQDVASTVFEAIGSLVAVERTARLAELDHARLEVVERPLDETVLLLVVRKEVVPERVLRKTNDIRIHPRTRKWTKTDLAEDLGVAKDDQAVLGASEGDVEPTRVVEESDALVLVASDARDDDVVLLATLERVDARDLDLLVELLLERAVELHVARDVGPLALVRRDDADLAREDAGLEEASDDLLDVRRLGPANQNEESAAAPVADGAPGKGHTG